MNRRVGDPLTPIVVQRGLRQDRSSISASTPPSSRAAARHNFLRKYPYRALAAQVLGYVGQISPRNTRREEAGYQPNDSMARPRSSRRTTRTSRQGRKAQLTVDSAAAEGRDHDVDEPGRVTLR
jgi:cell division protein FtsI/penicillin-binding protein 2